MSSRLVFSRFVLTAVLSILGGVLGGYLYVSGAEPQTVEPVREPAPSQAVVSDEEIAERVKNMIVEEMRQRVRESRSRRSGPSESESNEMESEWPVVEIDFAESEKHFSENEVSFFKTYGKKRVRIPRAIVVSVKRGESRRGDYAAQVSVSVYRAFTGASWDHLGYIACRVSEDQLSTVTDFKKGQRITVVGIPRAGGVGLVLDRCTFAPIGKD